MTLTNAYIVNSSSDKRHKNDFYPTAPIATLSLLRNHIVPDTLWEPAAGRGHISAELIRNGFTVTSTDLNKYDDPLVDIETGVDFTTTHFRDVAGVITNPPYMKDLPQKFIERYTEQYDFVAIFARLTFMESAKRYELFTKNPPSNIYIFSQRIQCSEVYFEPKENQIGGMVAYAWFVWDKIEHMLRSQEDQTLVKWIKPSLYVNEL